MSVSVFVGASVDGFIGRPDGSLDWLPAGGGEGHGYEEFLAGIDAIVIGRKTFETVLGFETWPYGVPLFRVLERDVRLRRVGTKTLANGLVQTEYAFR